MKLAKIKAEMEAKSKQ